MSLEKTYRGRRPVTWYELTAEGRSQLTRHIENLTRLIDRAR